MPQVCHKCAVRFDPICAKSLLFNAELACIMHEALRSRKVAMESGWTGGWVDRAKGLRSSGLLRCSLFHLRFGRLPGVVRCTLQGVQDYQSCAKSRVEERVIQSSPQAFQPNPAFILGTETSQSNGPKQVLSSSSVGRSDFGASNAISADACGALD